MKPNNSLQNWHTYYFVLKKGKRKETVEAQVRDDYDLFQVRFRLFDWTLNGWRIIKEGYIY